MHLIICLDSQNGWQFHNRRQSMDRLLRQDLMQYALCSAVWMDPYAASQFSPLPSNVLVDSQCIEKAGDQDLCFLESGDLSLAVSKADKLTIYRWDKVYPADRYLEDAAYSDFALCSSLEFAGHSHGKITREVYIREKA